MLESCSQGVEPTRLIEDCTNVNLKNGSWPHVGMDIPFLMVRWGFWHEGLEACVNGDG